MFQILRTPPSWAKDHRLSGCIVTIFGQSDIQNIDVLGKIYDTLTLCTNVSNAINYQASHRGRTGLPSLGREMLMFSHILLGVENGSLLPPRVFPP
ncbi:unnamed protein product [Pocillopora meandrina]|uniref:Uncharacterized protein n=1 Tax=Pocillopora meandrina TaxID=46732 RepID=A0AAU9XBA3_9CNID|nr:unnamed protein product [Pocillopora meandrina]